MDVTDCAEDTKEIKSDNGFGVPQSFEETLKDFWFGHETGQVGVETEKFEEWFEEVFERVGFGCCEGFGDAGYGGGNAEVIEYFGVCLGPEMSALHRRDRTMRGWHRGR
jgi:hypothetical protein